MLLIFRPFRVGDYITAGGVSGTVQEIALFTTDLDTPDNVRVVVPNSMLWGNAISNYSFHATRRCDLVFAIAYEDSIGKAIDLIRDEIAKDARAMAEPAPFVAVGDLADSAVNIVAWVWCKAGDYGSLKPDLMRAVKERFDAEGITIPFPQRTIHMAAD
jgi:small conductance mechanosensitive channel